jgi:hypothetical protein
VMNFGLWLLRTDKECVDHENDKTCPYVPQVCKFLTEEQPFHVIWQTTTPRLKEAHVREGTIGPDHHLQVPQRCNLDPSAVLNRVDVLHALEPDERQRSKLYHDHIHLSPAAYHAFNGRLLDMISSWSAGHGQLAAGDQRELDATAG